MGGGGVGGAWMGEARPRPSQNQGNAKPKPREQRQHQAKAKPEPRDRQGKNRGNVGQEQRGREYGIKSGLVRVSAHTHTRFFGSSPARGQSAPRSVIAEEILEISLLKSYKTYV